MPMRSLSLVTQTDVAPVRPRDREPDHGVRTDHGGHSHQAKGV